MKHTILTLALFTALNANATGNPLQGSSAISNASAIATQAQAQINAPITHNSANGGTSDANSDSISSIHYSNKRNPVSSAIAPAVDVNIICPVITVGGHAVQFIGFGGSTTGKANVNAICMAYHLGQVDVVEKMLCNTDVEYKKANVNCK